MSKKCPFRLANPFDPTDGSWYWATTDAYGGPGGATGNGSTDDRAAIQACINAAASQGKGVYFPAGTYRMIASGGVGLTIPSNVTLRGVGDTSALQLYDDGTDDRNALLSLAAGTSNITIKNLKLTGTQINKEASVQLIVVRGTNGLTVQGVTFDKGEYAVRNIYVGTYSYNVLVDDCKTLSGILNPFYIAGVVGMEVKDCNLDTNSVDCMPGRWPHHFYVERQVSNLHVHDCILSGGQHWAITLGVEEGSDGCSNLRFSRLLLTEVSTGLHSYNLTSGVVYDSIQASSTRYNGGEAWIMANISQNVIVKNSRFVGPSDKRTWLVESNGSSGCLIQDTSVYNCNYYSATPRGFATGYTPPTPPTYDNVTVSETGSGGTVVNYTP